MARADRGTSSVRWRGGANQCTFPPGTRILWRQRDTPAANKSEFTERKTHNACFACLNTKVQYNQSHLACVKHGTTASMAKRTEPKLRITGAALPGKAF